MIQPISGPPPGQPPGQGDNLPSGAGNQPLSSQQRTSLESLMTKVTSLTQQQRAELWEVYRQNLFIQRLLSNMQVELGIESYRQLPKAHHTHNCYSNSKNMEIME